MKRLCNCTRHEVQLIFQRAMVGYSVEGSCSAHVPLSATSVSSPGMLSVMKIRGKYN